MGLARGCDDRADGPVSVGVDEVGSQQHLPHQKPGDMVALPEPHVEIPVPLDPQVVADVLLLKRRLPLFADKGARSSIQARESQQSPPAPRPSNPKTSGDRPAGPSPPIRQTRSSRYSAQEPAMDRVAGPAAISPIAKEPASVLQVDPGTCPTCTAPVRQGRPIPGFTLVQIPRGECPALAGQRGSAPFPAHPRRNVRYRGARPSRSAFCSYRVEIQSPQGSALSDTSAKPALGTSSSACSA
jgi:hypothetical protein